MYIAGSGGGSAATNLPILNENYPTDTEFKSSASGHSFSVLIDKYPSGCAYQWYLNDQPIADATSSVYNFVPEDMYATYNIFCVVSNSLGSVTSRTAIVTVYPSKLYIVKDETVCADTVGGFTMQGSGGELWHNPFQICTKSTSMIRYKSDNKLPLNVYNNLYVKYSISPNSGVSGIITNMIEMVDISISGYYDNKTHEVNTEFSIASSDYMYLCVKSDGVDYTNIFFKDIYLS